MKKLLCLILFAGGYFVLPANAQLRKMQARVTNSFNAWYPDAKNVEWHDKISCYRANFEMNGVAYEAKFSRKGRWKGTEVYITEQNLPSSVKDGFKKSKYRNWGVKSSYVLYMPGEKTRYHVRVAKNDLHKKELVFNTQGQLIKDNMAI